MTQPPTLLLNERGANLRDVARLRKGTWIKITCRDSLAHGFSHSPFVSFNRNRQHYNNSLLL